MTEEEIYHQAMARWDADERAAYLQQACGGDATLRASTEALLGADVGASGFMDRPPTDERDAWRKLWADVRELRDRSAPQADSQHMSI